MAGYIDIPVRFLADASSVQAEASKIDGTGGKIKSWAKGIGAAMGAAFAVDQVKDWIGAASELQDSVSASEQIFGAAAGTVAKFADKAVTAFGMSRKEATDAANTFATFGKGAGLAGDDLSGFATNLTGVAGDLASFRGGSPEQAIEAVGAALRGETEPIRKYGVLLDDATLRARAMKLGLIDTTKNALTPQQKVLAAQAEVLAQTGDAQGDFARTSDSAANQQKILAAQMENTQAALGTALLPVLTAVLPILQAMAGFVQENAGWLVPLTAAVLGVTAAVWLFNAALAANPIVLVAIGIGLLIAAVILLWQNWDAVWSAIQSATAAAVDFILGLWHTVLDFFGGIPGWIADHWQLLLAILTGPFGLAVGWVIDHWAEVTGFFGSLPGLIGGLLGGLGDILFAPFRWAWDRIIEMKDGIVGLFGDAVQGAKNIWNGFARFWNGINVTVGGQDPLGDFGPSLPEFTLRLPHIPELAAGGIVSRPTLAMIGERGPEAVVPLPAHGFGSTVIQVNVTARGLGADAPAIQTAVVDALRGYVGRNGPLPGIAR